MIIRAALKDTDAGLANSKAIGEREIHALMEDLANAIRAKDVDSLMTHYASDVLTFDLLPPLQYQGVDAIRQRVSQWFSSFRGPIGLEMRHLSITAGDDVAFCSSLNGSTGINKDGAKIEMWWRGSRVCFLPILERRKVSLNRSSRKSAKRHSRR